VEDVRHRFVKPHDLINLDENAFQGHQGHLDSMLLSKQSYSGRVPHVGRVCHMEVGSPWLDRLNPGEEQRALESALPTVRFINEDSSCNCSMISTFL